MPSERASGATCVQKLDDSRNSAIHITYRISLRSSSLQEPRYPLLRVVSVMHVRDRRPDSSPDIEREGGRAAPEYRLSRWNSPMFGAHASRLTPAGGRNARAPAGAESRRRAGGGVRRGRQPDRPGVPGPDERAPPQRIRRGAPSEAGSTPTAAPPDAAPHWTSTVRRVYSIGVSMILPQVHLRKPCYDFSFL
ncbi:hypothetical protein O6H91_11G040300 [Diphasiastrum complanatum]|uniref:Uncharacterized protein n=1 Tax=Diphasiastrum complanatum TaxID=34168 RepID=A0ACC2C8C8_DIPCM|nr:hypothetical protein O6H91_11G040300 [Diphasiastrum complanatum]